jgi:hypothetical protein
MDWRLCEFVGMKKGVEVRLGPVDREWLEAVIGSGNSPQKQLALGLGGRRRAARRPLV